MHLLDEEKRSEEHERLDQARKRILKETMNVSEAGFFGHMGLLFVWNGTMLPHVLPDPLFLFGVAGDMGLHHSCPFPVQHWQCIFD